MKKEEKEIVDNNFLKNSINLKNIREERKKEVSKETLFKSCKKKVQTTMIGALDVVEKHFGFLWAFQEGEDLTSEQKQLKDIYEEARASILDRGNTQIRNMEAEFSHYEISKKRYQINLPVIGKNSTKQGEVNDGQE
jgi:transcription termination factor Rho